jgi:hypothetical protein
MPRSYCSVSDVKQYLPPNVVTEGDNPVPYFRNPTPESASRPMQKKRVNSPIFALPVASIQ